MLTEIFTDLADSVRKLTSTDDKLTPSGMIDNINSYIDDGLGIMLVITYQYIEEYYTNYRDINYIILECYRFDGNKLEINDDNLILESYIKFSRLNNLYAISYNINWFKVSPSISDIISLILTVKYSYRMKLYNNDNELLYEISDIENGKKLKELYLINRGTETEIRII